MAFSSYTTSDFRLTFVFIHWKEKEAKTELKNLRTTLAIIHCGIMQITKIETNKRPDFISGKVYDVSHNEIIA